MQTNASKKSSNAGVPGAVGDRGGFVVGAVEGGGFGGALFLIEGVVTLAVVIGRDGVVEAVEETFISFKEVNR